MKTVESTSKFHKETIAPIVEQINKDMQRDLNKALDKAEGKEVTPGTYDASRDEWIVTGKAAPIKTIDLQKAAVQKAKLPAPRPAPVVTRPAPVIYDDDPISDPAGYTETAASGGWEDWTVG